jgi:glutaredoxin-like protein NrdH
MAEPVPVLYTQSGCAESARVRTWLTERGVPFVEHNVTGDVSTARALAATGIFATPLLIVGRRRVVGYRPEALRAALHAERSVE